jgi:hypothetical protein
MYWSWFHKPEIGGNPCGIKGLSPQVTSHKHKSENLVHNSGAYLTLDSTNREFEHRKHDFPWFYFNLHKH